MSLGKLGAMCGCGTGQVCGDCQAVPVYSVDLLNNRWGFGRIIGEGPGLGARWAVPTNYDPALHRHYTEGSSGAFGRVVSLNKSDALVYQRPQPAALGEIALGESGWMLSDVASLGLIVLAAIAVWKEIRR